MIRKTIKIDEEKCNGCGLCVQACHEGAIAIVDGKAALVRDDYCDGLGNCLPVCPTEAISFDEKTDSVEPCCPGMGQKQDETLPCGCPGTNVRTLSGSSQEERTSVAVSSELRQWPIQIRLVPVNAPYFDGAKLLIAADCTAFACGNFHSRFMKGKITLIGCPKLDNIDYTEKLTEIISRNNIKSAAIIRMEVPCCSGIEQALVSALKNSGKMLPWQVYTLSTSGVVLEE